MSVGGFSEDVGIGARHISACREERNCCPVPSVFSLGTFHVILFNSVSHQEHLDVHAVGIQYRREQGQEGVDQGVGLQGQVTGGLCQVCLEPGSSWR